MSLLEAKAADWVPLFLAYFNAKNAGVVAEDDLEGHALEEGGEEEENVDRACSGKGAGPSGQERHGKSQIGAR